MADKYKWDGIAARIWRYSRTPSRPHKSDIAFIEGIIKNLIRHKKPKVLILGSTPELRDICIKYGLIPTVVDYSRYNFKHLKGQMKRRGKEILVVQDWRKMNLNKKFDIILGDLSLNMVGFKDQKIILRKLSKLAESKGFIAHRTWLYEESRYASLNELIEAHRKRRNINT